MANGIHIPSAAWPIDSRLPRMQSGLQSISLKPGLTPTRNSRAAKTRSVRVKIQGLPRDFDIFTEVTVHLVVHFKPPFFYLHAVWPENLAFVSSLLIGKIGN